jgi:hypothetical protein
MNVTKYLDFDSSYRDISAFPNPAVFEIPLTYYSYTGSTVSQQQLVDYEITLDYLILPNTSVEDDKYGGTIVACPYVYVELQNTTSGLYNIMYSNNPAAKRMLFKAIIDDYGVPGTTAFIKLKSVMTQTIKFKPNDILKFGVYLPDGTTFKSTVNNIILTDGVITSTGQNNYDRFYYDNNNPINGNKLVLQGPNTVNVLTNYTSGNSYTMSLVGSDANGNFIVITGITTLVSATTNLNNGLSFNIPSSGISGTIIKVGPQVGPFPNNKLYYISSSSITGNNIILTGAATVPLFLPNILSPLNYISGTSYDVTTGIDVPNKRYITFTNLAVNTINTSTALSGLTFYNPLNQISALFSIKRLV